MGRALTAGLDAAQLAQERRPDFQVLVYDIISGNDKINDVVRGVSLDALTGPRDFTSDVESLEIDERAGDYVSTGIASSSLKLTIIDAIGALDPLLGSNGRWLKAGNVVRILEGDTRVDISEWALTFTGKIVGQQGYTRSRTSGTSVIEVMAVDRSAPFIKYLNTSKNFVQGTTYKAMALDIATSDMGLDLSEINWSAWGDAHTTNHLSTQAVEEPPLVEIAKIMFIDGVMPYFNGAGILTQTDGVITKAPTRVYSDNGLQLDIVRPPGDLNAVNCVTVLGLEQSMTPIDQQEQELADIQITTGYFSPNEEIEVFWSEDRTLQSRNTRMEVLQSVNGGLSLLGGDESYAETLLDTGDPTKGSLGGVISIETGFAPYVIIFLTATYVALSLAPDGVQVGITGTGFTFSIGRRIQALALAAALLLMTKIGRGHFKILGSPFEFVFLEIRATACVDGVLSEDIVEAEINNQLIQTQSDGDIAAAFVLFREQAKANTRSITMVYDLLLEPDDILETESGRRYMIVAQQRTLSRAVGAIIATIQAFEVTPGAFP